MKYRRLAALTCAPLTAGAMYLASTAPASAAPSARSTQISAARTSGQLVQTVTGTVAGGQTETGSLTINRFVNDSGVLTAIGTLSMPSLAGGAPQAVAVPVDATDPPSCQVLHLDLGPLSLNLLGLQVNLNEVVLDITAVPGAGNLLGNLLCAVTHLLDNGASVSGIAALLNNILGALSSL